MDRAESAAAPAASIIIPTYRRESLLRSLLLSLARQKTSYDFDVTVVGDGTEVDAEAIGFDSGWPAVRFLSLERKVGRGAARNVGIRASSGGIVIFLDDDMTVAEGFVEEHVRHHGNGNTVVIGDVLSPPEYSRHPLARYIQRQGVRKLKSRDEIPPKCFRTGNASVGRQLLEKAGLFDESITHYGEDMDLAVRLADAGARFVFAEAAAAYHHHPPDLDDMIVKMREYGRHTVPVLVDRHPYLRKTLRINLVDPVRPAKEPLKLSLKKVALRLVLNPAVYGLVLCAMQFPLPDRLRFPAYDYIRAYNYISEYLKARRDEALVKKDGTADYTQ
jgi:GT2 family glycosyltransferase